MQTMKLLKRKKDSSEITPTHIMVGIIFSLFMRECLFEGCILQTNPNLGPISSLGLAGSSFIKL